jgi:two-component system, chemotaxis family, response regulator Rcp1
MRKLEIRILWAEDSIGDILLIKEAFKQADLNPVLIVVNDGVEALDYLFRRERFARARCPDLIILDVNMPKKSGREVIAEIKKNDTLSRIPIIVLTTSDHDQDVLKDFDPKRCLYIVKPSGFQALVDMAKLIHNFWEKLNAPQT